jgi:hypothetical protein
MRTSVSQHAKSCKLHDSLTTKALATHRTTKSMVERVVGVVIVVEAVGDHHRPLNRRVAEDAEEFAFPARTV